MSSDDKWVRLARVFRSKPVRILAEFGRTFEGLAAIGVGIVSVATAVVRHLPVFPEFRPYSDWILVPTTLLSFCFTLHFYARARRVQHAANEQSGELIQLRQEKELLAKEVRALVSVQEPFSTFAFVNARCDKRIFEILNAVILDGLTAVHAVDLALAEVHGNIEFTLQTACDVLKGYTGNECAASVKVIRRWDGGAKQIDGAKLMTVFRDIYSHRKRKANDHVLYGIHDNTAIERILLHEDPVWMCNDLRALASCGKYKNGRKGWELDYNATIAVPVPEFSPIETPARNWGIFFADSLVGNFDTENCKRYMEELCSRLAVMLYRHERLKEIRMELTSRTKNA